MSKPEPLRPHASEPARLPGAPARPELLAGLDAASRETQLGAAAFLAPGADDPERERLLSWLRRAAHSDHGLHFTRSAVERVGGLVGAHDAGWVLDLYFDLSHASFAAHLVHPFGLLGLLDHVPERVRADRLRRESASSAAAVRRAAFEAACRLTDPARAELLLLFRGERHPAFARRVRSLLALEGLVD